MKNKIVIKNRKLKKNGTSFFMQVPMYFVKDSQEIDPEKEYDMILIEKENAVFGIFAHDSRVGVAL